MAILVTPGQVAVSDPAAGTGPSTTSNVKDVVVKAVKLTSANFSTTAVNTMVARLPADATILGFRFWVKTQLAGNSISAATVSIGSASAGTQFVSASALAFGAAGTYTVMPAVTGIFQNYNVPLGSDIDIWVSGLATTGIPTSGEMYLAIEYVR